MAIVHFTDRPLYRNPWAEFEKMRQDLARLSVGHAQETAANIPYATVYPPMNITEDDENIYISAEMPGITPDSPEVFVEGDTLTIKGERLPVTTDTKVSYHRREINYGSYNRSITLPTLIKADKVTAKAIDGILHITLPKAEEMKPKKISIAVG